MNMDDAFADLVYAYVSKIPPGKVVSYGDVAKALGRPASARVVGNILKRNPKPFYKVNPDSVKARRPESNVPCHRVVRADLKLGGYTAGYAAKKRLLENEGVKMNGSRVAPEHRFIPPPEVHIQNPLL